jgi:Glycosyl hydrolase catalytic core
MTHFAQFNDPAVIPLLARAGIAHFRDEQYWGSIELERDVYRYPKKFTSYMSAASAVGLHPLVVLTWSNDLYDYEEGDYTFPHTDLGREAYIKYALNLLEHYHRQLHFVEVWNEANAGTFIVGPAAADKPSYYSLLLKQAYPAIKASFPSVKVVAGATVPVAHGFLRDLFEKGALSNLDVVSIHPYGDILDGLCLDIEELRNLIRSYNGGQTKPIWATEFSFGASSEDDRYIAASYLAQAVCLMLSENVERMYYYLALDDELFPFRGLMGAAADDRGPFRPHPTFVAYATLIRQLEDAAFQRRFNTAPSTYAFAFQRGNEQISALWSTYPVVVQLASASPLVITNLMGGTETKSPALGRVSIKLSTNVQYVVGPVTAVTEVGNQLVADSVSGYSNTAGENGWYYGYAEVGSGETYDPSKFLQMSWAIWGSDNFRWQCEGSYPFARGSQMHPSTAWAVRRWVSDIEGQVTLSGLLARGEGGDGVAVRIFVDGNEIWHRDLLPAEAIKYSVPNVAVTIGSQVDFAVTQRSESSFDATTFTSTVMRPCDTLPSRPQD